MGRDRACPVVYKACKQSALPNSEPGPGSWCQFIRPRLCHTGRGICPREQNHEGKLRQVFVSQNPPETGRERLCSDEQSSHSRVFQRNHFTGVNITLNVLIFREKTKQLGLPTQKMNTSSQSHPNGPSPGGTVTSSRQGFWEKAPPHLMTTCSLKAEFAPQSSPLQSCA